MLRAAAVVAGIVVAANLEPVLYAATWVVAVWGVLLGWGA